MTKTKNKYSTCKAVKYDEEGKEKVFYYLSERDVEQGKDIALDLEGFTIIAI